MRNMYMPVSCLLLLGILSACNKQDETTTSAKVPASKAKPAAATPISLAPRGNSGLIPEVMGVAVFDVARIENPKPKGAACAVDKIEGNDGVATTEFAAGSAIHFTGWVLTPKLKSPASFAILLLGNGKAYAIPGAAGRKRPDVAKFLKSRGAGLSGYNLSTKLDGVAPGNYAISLLQDAGDVVSVCKTKRSVTIQ